MLEVKIQNCKPHLRYLLHMEYRHQRIRECWFKQLIELTEFSEQ